MGNWSLVVSWCLIVGWLLLPADCLGVGRLVGGVWLLDRYCWALSLDDGC